jgi:hypothetical protein
MKPGDVLGVWGWYLGICSICTKFGADLCVFPAKFAKTRKLNQTFAYNDMIEGFSDFSTVVKAIRYDTHRILFVDLNLVVNDDFCMISMP